MPSKTKPKLTPKTAGVINEHPATTSSPNDEETHYHSRKSAQAAKTGRRAAGALQYRVLTDAQTQALYLMIVGNDGGGYYSQEAVAFNAIEQCLAALTQGEAFPSKRLQAVFSGKSINNAGFLAAILRAEGLLQAVPDKTHLHQRCGDWTAWRASMLALPTEPFSPPVKAVNLKVKANTTPEIETPMSTNQDDLQTETESDDPVAFLTGRKPRPLPGEKSHPSLYEEADHVDTA